MLFNSYEFIFIYLPITLIAYFILNKQRLTLASKSWLVLASLVFYGYWNIAYLPLVVGSMIFNYSIGTALGRIDKRRAGDRHKFLGKRSIVVFGITVNLFVLGVYKYYDFFASNINSLADTDMRLLHLVLPLGISFYTFTQIAYLVDAYRGEAREYDFMNYALFVTFFPHLIAGPILHHREMMPQFDSLRNKVLNYKNLTLGLFLFSVGLFKKVMVADTLAQWVNTGFSNPSVLTFIEAWATSLSYTLQLYYDFSGYTDMALGTALMINIHLPINFNSPYKAVNIQDFWRRWHMTLSRFLRDYIYIPLGGNKQGELRTCINLIATFLLGGIWHGAGWPFVIWGLMHGTAIVVLRMWQKLNVRMPKLLAWLITFTFVNVTWIFFRASTFSDAINIIQGMLGMRGIVLHIKLEKTLYFLKASGITFGFWNLNNSEILIPVIISALISVFFARNSLQFTHEGFQFNRKWQAVTITLMLISILNMNKISEFLYFQF